MDKKLSSALEKMVRHPKAPNSLDDFLSDAPVKVELKKEGLCKREEFRFSVSLSEELRQTAYKLQQKKSDVVRDALVEYFAKINR